MATLIGILVIFGLLGSGAYVYSRIELVDRQIALRSLMESGDPDDE